MSTSNTRRCVRRLINNSHRYHIIFKRLPLKQTNNNNKNNHVAAILPTGTGPPVVPQKTEYGVFIWLVDDGKKRDAMMWIMKFWKQMTNVSKHHFQWIEFESWKVLETRTDERGREGRQCQRQSGYLNALSFVFFLIFCFSSKKKLIVVVVVVWHCSIPCVWMNNTVFCLADARCSMPQPHMARVRALIYSSRIYFGD